MSLEDDAEEPPFWGPQWCLRVSHVRDQLSRTVVMSDEACARLAEDLALESFEALTCAIEIKPARRGRFAGTLHLIADIKQRCVISLEVFSSRIEETLDIEFWPQAQIDAWDAGRGKEAEVNDETPDPEPIVEDILNVGGLAREALVMAVDPHPRAPDASFGQMSTETDADLADERPFAALAKLRGGNSSPS